MAKNWGIPAGFGGSNYFSPARLGFFLHSGGSPICQGEGQFLANQRCLGPPASCPFSPLFGWEMLGGFPC